MTVFQHTLHTSQNIQFINIDQMVHDAVIRSDVNNGICVIFVPHTTAGITINENADPEVVRDLIVHINKIIPLKDNYQHSEGNSAAHIKATLIGSSVTLIFENRQILLGTWQSIFFCEFDGPRVRKVIIKVINE
jgi:secondary thiamine-phosphate synthase enzyme